MDRAFNSFISATPPAPPAVPLIGYPTSGNPTEGIPATRPGPYWFHMMTEELRNVILSAGMVPDATNLSQLALALDKLITARIKFPCLFSGTPLPSEDIGPIWHDDYNSIMTWQVFDANGADYEGYASINVGMPVLDAQPSARKGFVPSGTSNLGRTAYAALRNWAIHNGLLVAESAWAPGTVRIKDNSDGLTFTLYDLRGRFPRAWSNGSTVDSGRGFGTAQGDAIRDITGFFDAIRYAPTNVMGGSFNLSFQQSNMSMPGGSSFGTGNIDFSASRVVPTAAENRPTNTALYPAVKF
jgi:hypothetical protein